jgi:glucose/arabinose dehydrogenase
LLFTSTIISSDGALIAIFYFSANPFASLLNPCPVFLAIALFLYIFNSLILKKMKKITLLLILFSMTAAVNGQSDLLPKFRLQDFSSGYDQPLGIVNCGDSRLFIVERTGKIWICDSAGNKSANPFLDISDSVLTADDEQGLLGLAFDPDYSANRKFYINYISKTGNSRISRFKVSLNNPDSADRSTEYLLLHLGQPFPNHNGGQLQFGPDGYLYASFGDGGDAADPFNNGQDLNTLLGKIIRIDVHNTTGNLRYGIPPTNPFVGMAGHREEIWASGLRNPWRFTFDSQNGNMWIGDVGQNNWEEINFQPSTSTGGENYGWGCWEGAHFFKSNCDANNIPPVFPIAEYPHTTSACSGSIIGGYVYRGQQFPRLMGKYIYTDFCTGVFRTVYKDHDVWVNRYLRTEEPFSYTSFGENMNGDLFVSSASTGEIYAIVDSTIITPSFTAQSENQAMRINSANDGRLLLYPNPNTGEFTVQMSAVKEEILPVTIVNHVGQVILSGNRSLHAGINEWSFSILDLKKGIYFIQVQTEEGTVAKKFSVQ